MADYRIICTLKESSAWPSGHEHIAQVGTGVTTDKYSQLWTRQQVVTAIDARQHTFHTIGSSSGKRAAVYTAECPHNCGTRIIRTNPDDKKDNNLDQLIRCG